MVLRLVVEYWSEHGPFKGTRPYTDVNGPAVQPKNVQMAPPSHCRTVNGGAPRNGAIAVETPATSESSRLLDADEFRRLGHQVVDFIADYYAGLGDYPVHPGVAPGFLRRQLPADAPCRPEPEAFAAALRDVRDLLLPGMTHWQSPRHFAHFPASSSTVGALGGALAAGINVVPFTWAASPAATELEMRLREHIRSHVRMAAAFEAMVRADARFEVAAPRRFALVCFRLLLSPEKELAGGEKAANELNRRLLEEVNAASSGPYMSSAMVGGVYMLRCAIGSTLTEERHVREAWNVVQERATSILRKRG
uniref:Tyrosine decarboxylase n=1 Tax=Oryza brachyantha TaxID=4533 RepID=J3L4H3_ORYBR